MKLWSPSLNKSRLRDGDELSAKDKLCTKMFAEIAQGHPSILLNPKDEHFIAITRLHKTKWIHWQGPGWPQYFPALDVIAEAAWQRVEQMIRFVEEADCEARPYKQLPQWEEIETRIAERVVEKLR